MRTQEYSQPCRPESTRHACIGKITRKSPERSGKEKTKRYLLSCKP
ncbi:MAG: hypothetical protein NC344_09420 [Bacteroidales bacterium]|nr:hypothetical protein [Bacteroidales bacterium]MCM1148027.1 hypothetical protein [Bacteroidales bacterium]MCM1511017.1 hypothetical protein [Clostridium sp.]